MPRTWTPEQRAEFGEKMKQKRAAKKVSTEATSDIRDVEKSSPGYVEYNPLPTDHIEIAKGKRASARVAHPKPGNITVKDIGVTPGVEVSFLLDKLPMLPVDSISFDDCGLLLNALSACSTKIALRRRQAQEQLDAGSAKAPCSTCGRSIDISKPGGFQILTVRDEFFQPKNVFYCSQNCLLARNMPSHRVKKLPGDVGARS